MIDLTTEEGQTEYINKIKEEVFDFNHPVGFNYTQYPGGKSPEEMHWRGTWEKVFDNDSCSFVTEGTASPSFDGDGIFEEHYSISHGNDSEHSRSNKRSKRIWVRIA